ncbi:MAG: Ppx/GppA phosphatase family protein [Pseudomonadota bacterium]
MAVPSAPDHFRVIGSFSRIVRLGDGLEHSGRLRQDAMDRAVEALKICSQRLGAGRIRKARLIATEACRRAENGSAFLTRVREEAGLELEIVDRETEARLAVAGCGSLIDPRAKGAVLFDIGGGSTEIALLDLHKRKSQKPSDHIQVWTSLPVGVVTLADRFGGADVTRDVYDAMVDWVSKMIAEFDGRDALAELHNSEHFHLLGTSGTVTTLAGIHLKLEQYDRRRVDGTWMANRQMTAMVDELLSMDLEQRKASPCIGKDRADLVLAGCAILDAIRLQWPSRRLRVADRGLREGLLMEMMHEDSAWLGLQTQKRKSGRRP